jgi:hypothetical protein
MPTTANSIITPQVPKSNAVVTTTATAAAPYGATPTNTQKLATMGANGGRVVRLRSRPRNTVTATNLLLFVSFDGGITKLLIDSVLMPAFTVAASTAIPSTDWGYSDLNPMMLASNAELYVANGVTLTDGIVTEIEWSDY